MLISSEQFSLLHWILMDLTPGKLYILCVRLTILVKLIREPKIVFKSIKFEIVMPSTENHCEVC